MNWKWALRILLFQWHFKFYFCGWCKRNYFDESNRKPNFTFAVGNKVTFVRVDQNFFCVTQILYLLSPLFSRLFGEVCMIERQTHTEHRYTFLRTVGFQKKSLGSLRNERFNFHLKLISLAVLGICRPHEIHEWI